MNKAWKSLGVELLLATMASLTAAALVFLGLRQLAYAQLDKIILSEAFDLRQQSACVERLQEYISRHQVAAADRTLLDKWTAQHDIFLALYRDGRPIYDSLAIYPEDIPLEVAPALETDSLISFSKSNPVYEILFADGAATAIVSCFSQYRYYAMADAACACAAFLAFVIILLALIRRKTRYIRQLVSELKILEGGDLSYPMTIRGWDELASLANGIDAMRRAIRERQAREEQAQNANRELITAMSHDLRTPLTALMGYLDIVALRKYSGEEQMRQCILAGREKAYRIKELSDKLFEYFLVYGREGEPLELEEVYGTELVGQLVEESLFDLESEGFQVALTPCELYCRLRVDPGLLRRVFGNLFSNLLKYADRDKPVEVSYRQEQDNLTISFCNSIDSGPKPESTQIGLRTCEVILKRHGGTFRHEVRGNRFFAIVTLPLYPFRDS